MLLQKKAPDYWVWEISSPIGILWYFHLKYERFHPPATASLLFIVTESIINILEGNDTHLDRIGSRPSGSITQVSALSAHQKRIV
jgi:hypothetical protein